MTDRPFHYLDNASTVFPKPAVVLEEMTRFYSSWGVNPGRGAFHRARVAGSLIEEARKTLCSFFGGKVPERLVFLSNSTEALNTAFFGLLKPGDHVLSTNLEHNSVLRPLNALAAKGDITMDYLPFDEDGRVSVETFRAALRPETRMVAVNHGSNVFGVVQDLAEIGRFCRENGLLFVVDTSQTAGVLPLDVEEMNIDVLCFTGHKSLLGPTGTGGLYVREGVEIEPSRFGGSGIQSDNPLQPREMPYRLEVGTANTIGIIGLKRGVEWILERGLDAVHRREMELYRALLEGVRDVEGVKVFFPDSPLHVIPVLSIAFDRIPAEEAGRLLDERYGIATRCGCHCAPLAHKQAGTYPVGTVRLSIGPFTSERDVETAVKAVRELAAS